MVRYHFIVVAILFLFIFSLNLHVSYAQSVSKETSSFPLEKGYVNGKIVSLLQLMPQIIRQLPQYRRTSIIKLTLHRF